MINFPENKNYITSAYNNNDAIIIIVTKEFFSFFFFFYITDPVQSGIFIFSCQNCVSIALTCTNYHEMYATLSGLKNKIF